MRPCPPSVLPRLGVLITSGGLALACGPSGPPPRSPDAIHDEYKERLAAVYERAKDEVYWPTCEVPPKRGKGCGLVFEEMVAPEAISKFIVERCREDPSIVRVSDACNELFRRTHLEAVRQRYTRANADDVARACGSEPEKCDRSWKVELLFMTSHNARVREDAVSEGDKIVAEHAKEQRSATAMREQREREAESARRAWAAVGGALQGASQGLQRGSGTGATEAEPQTPTSRGCRSDFECGFGNVCAKPEGRFDGTCARAVNQYGTPTYQTPRSDSYGPGGPGQCMFDTDCGIGFKCIKGTALRGNCMR